MHQIWNSTVVPHSFHTFPKKEGRSSIYYFRCHHFFFFYKQRKKEIKKVKKKERGEIEPGSIKTLFFRALKCKRSNHYAMTPYHARV